MGISHKLLSSVESNLRFNGSDLLGFGPEGRTDQRRIPKGVAFAGGREKVEAQQHVSAALGERILALYDEYRPRLFRYICSMNLSRDQAEEVIQETFLRLTTQLMQDDRIENVQGWIVRVAHNFAVDLLKRGKRDAEGSSSHDLGLDTFVDPTPNPEERYASKERENRMSVALATLNPQQRQCFDLRARGFRYKDIGVAYGISEQRAAFIVKQAAVRLAEIFS